MNKKVKPRWWCIERECKYYKQFHCTHQDVFKMLNVGKIRIKNLKMCPILACIEACLGLV